MLLQADQQMQSDCSIDIKLKYKKYFGNWNIMLFQWKLVTLYNKSEKAIGHMLIYTSLTITRFNYL